MFADQDHLIEMFVVCVAITTLFTNVYSEDLS
jgi:hypothetical protein